jgi:hypothetical protein
MQHAAFFKLSEKVAVHLRQRNPRRFAAAKSVLHSLFRDNG